MSDRTPESDTPTSVSLPVPATSTMWRVNGVDLHVVAAGASDDPLVLLLHGFPEFWYSWHRHVARFVDAGYRVLVPDMRGYNASEKPAGVEQYRLAELVRDVVGLVETEKRPQAHVVGHDWGAMVAWTMAQRYPDRVDRLGIVNVPHPAAMRRALFTRPRQVGRSWYAGFFQVPGVPEFLWRRYEQRVWRAALGDAARPGTFDETDRERYLTAWNQPGARTGMLNWYRAVVRHPPPDVGRSIAAPTLVVWGDRDTALVPELATDSLAYCEHGRLERFPAATHWVHHEFPERVGTLLLDHLGR